MGNILGVSAVILLASGLLLARVLHRPFLYMIFCLSALACSVVPVVRGRKAWLCVSVLAGLLSAQAIFAALVE